MQHAPKGDKRYNSALMALFVVIIAINIGECCWQKYELRYLADSLQLIHCRDFNMLVAELDKILVAKLFQGTDDTIF